MRSQGVILLSNQTLYIHVSTRVAMPSPLDGVGSA